MREWERGVGMGKGWEWKEGAEWKEGREWKKGAGMGNEEWKTGQK